jgi:hypothetical protein
MEIFIDESGDLGFGQKSSQKYVIAHIAPERPDALRKKLNKTRKNLFKKSYDKPEFKFSGDSERVKQKVFRVLSSYPMVIGLVVIEKSAVKSSLRDKPAVLYNYLVVNYVINNILPALQTLQNHEADSITIQIDKSLTKDAREEFDRYLQNKNRRVSSNLGHFPRRIKVIHKNSCDDPCIQAADYIAGAAFRKFERNDPVYYDTFRDRIRLRNSWGNIGW